MENITDTKRRQLIHDVKLFRLTSDITSVLKVVDAYDNIYFTGKFYWLAGH